MATSEQKELKINQLLEELDESLEDGPDESPELFLRETANKARELVGAIEALTVFDVSEIWIETSEESEDVTNDVIE